MVGNLHTCWSNYVISWEATVSQGWGKIARDDKLYSMASRVPVFDADIPLRESVFFLGNSSSCSRNNPDRLYCSSDCRSWFQKESKVTVFRFFLVYSWVTCSRKILILLATACHLDLKERSVKVRISYKVLHILSGWHYKTRDCRAVKNLLFSIWHFDN